MAISTKMTKLVDNLIALRCVTQQQIDVALAEQKQTHESLGKILVNRGFITEETLTSLLCLDLDIEHLPTLEGIEIAPEVIKLFPPEFVVKYKCIPLYIQEGELTVGLSNPYDIVAMDAINDMIRNTDESLIVKCVSVNEDEVLKAIDSYYFDKTKKEALDESIQETIQKCLKELEGTTDADASSLPVQTLVDQLLALGAVWKASDIHINPLGSHVQMRYRVDGILCSGPSIPTELQNSIISRIKLMSKLNISERRLPQDGKISFKYDKIDIDLRVSTMPITLGENIVIRILEKNKLFSLRSIGFNREMLKNIEGIISKNFGLFLVTGPTGSGKSTSLYSCLKSLNAIEKNIVTIEDPVEYQLPFIRQSQVNHTIGYTFASGLRAFLRHDPNVILVGEIRDKETAEMAVHAAQTGHLVLSTLHTNTAIGAIPRLLYMEIDLFMLTSILNGVLAQRLARSLCPYCKESYMSTPSENEWLGLNPEKPVKLYKQVGCKKCKGNGYRGRRAIYELFMPDDDIRSLMLQKVDEIELKKACLAKGMTFFRQDAIAKVLDGTTTILEAMRVLPEH